MHLDPLVKLSDLPIPPDVQPTRLWTDQMLEMAAHIGAYSTLLLIDRLGGQTIRVTMSAEKNRMATIIDAEATAIMSRVYGGNQITLPAGKAALDEARRGPIIAAIRDGVLTINQAVPILRSTRTRISHIVRHSSDGVGVRAWSGPRQRQSADPRQIPMFPEPADN